MSLRSRLREGRVYPCRVCGDPAARTSKTFWTVGPKLVKAVEGCIGAHDLCVRCFLRHAIEKLGPERVVTLTWTRIAPLRDLLADYEQPEAET